MMCNVLAAGMMTSVGLSAPASSAAIRVGISGIQETHYSFDGDWLHAASVPVANGLQGRDKLLHIARCAIQECVEAMPCSGAGDTALLVCLPENSRPGRLERLDTSFGAELRQLLASESQERFAPDVRVFQRGTIGGVEGLEQAGVLLSRGLARYVVLVGVDSYVQRATLAGYYALGVLKTAVQQEGFTPGEAAAALLLGRIERVSGALQCLGVGYGREPATAGSEWPLRGDGTAESYRRALAAANCSFEQLDYRIVDLLGDGYGFKDAALGLLRTMRVRKEFFDLWHPSECIGRVGAAALPVQIGVALTAARRQYAPGPGVLCHVSGDDGARAAVVLRQWGARPALRAQRGLS